MVFLLQMHHTGDAASATRSRGSLERGRPRGRAPSFALPAKGGFHGPKL